MVAARLWAAVPWLAVALPIYALAAGYDTVLAGALLVTAVVAASAGSVAIVAANKDRWAPSRVQPYTWRQILASRLTVVVGIGGALIGAAATLVAVLFAQL